MNTERVKRRSSENFETRKIIYLDLEAFFVSLEQLDNPDLRRK